MHDLQFSAEFPDADTASERQEPCVHLTGFPLSVAHAEIAVEQEIRSVH